MFNSLSSKLKYLFVLFLFLGLPFKAYAGAIPNPFPATVHQNTETSSFLQYYYWDLRDRDSYIQVTNLSSSATKVHVQIFDAAKNCLRVSFFDDYTRFDTHVYDMRNIQKNSDGSTPVLVDDGGFGFVVVSVVIDVVIVEDDQQIFPHHIIGNFRIIDGAGYEYRTNSVTLGKQAQIELFVEDDGLDFLLIFDGVTPTSGYAIHYSSPDGAQFSDVIGVPMILTAQINFNDDTGELGIIFDIFAGAPIVALFNPTFYDSAENPRDCPNIAFTCATELTDPIRSTILGIGGITTVTGFCLGISPAVPNSRGEKNMCSVADTEGWIEFDNAVFFFDPDGALTEPFNTILGNFFVGFVGLNNGTDTGSMDSWFQRGCISDVKDIFTGNTIDNCLDFL